MYLPKERKRTLCAHNVRMSTGRICFRFTPMLTRVSFGMFSTGAKLDWASKQLSGYRSSPCKSWLVSSAVQLARPKHRAFQLARLQLLED